MLSLADYFSFLPKQTTPQSETEMLADKEKAATEFELAKQAFSDTLQQLIKNDTDLATFCSKTQVRLDGKENTALLQKLSTADAKQTYQQYIKTSQRLQTIDQKLTTLQDEKKADAKYLETRALLDRILHETAENYRKDRAVLYGMLQNIPDNELEQLNHATKRLLQYVDQHQNITSKSQLSEIIASLCELLKPSDVNDPTRVSIHTQKVRFHLGFLVMVKYAYDFESSQRYSNFVQHVDQVSGARKKINENNINLFLSNFVVCLVILSLSLLIILALGGSFPLVMTLAWGSMGVICGAIALAVHLSGYPRMGLSKHLAIVAEAALPIENSRLDNAEAQRDQVSYKEKFDELNELKTDFSPLLVCAAQFIHASYYKSESPKKGLILLEHLQAVLEAQSHEDFTRHKNTLVQALDRPKPKRGCFFCSQPQDEEIPSSISALLEAVGQSLLSKEHEQNVARCAELLGGR